MICSSVKPTEVTWWWRLINNLTITMSAANKTIDSLLKCQLIKINNRCTKVTTMLAGITSLASNSNSFRHLTTNSSKIQRLNHKSLPILMNNFLYKLMHQGLEINSNKCVCKIWCNSNRAKIKPRILSAETTQQKMLKLDRTQWLFRMMSMNIRFRVSRQSALQIHTIIDKLINN